jgi:arylsulfatase A-like enzyme
MLMTSSRTPRLQGQCGGVNREIVPAPALMALVAVLVAPISAGPRQVSTSPRTPNVLLIVTDDQGYGDLGATGNPHLSTPNLDRLAGESVVFDRFFVSPVCAPTRASLLTGRYHLRTGTWGVTGGRETMRGDEVTLAEVLRARGYRTGVFGKWHNGAHVPSTPRAQGFDEFFGFRGGHWNLYFDADLERDGRPVKTKGYIADVLADEALRFIERSRQQPFFCYLAFNTPHSPLQVPDKYYDPFRRKGLNPTLASVYGMVANIDDNVGRLLARLDALGLRDNTIVMYLSDNGPAGDRYNAGMRGRKGSVHEGGGRVPFYLRWPARLQPRRVDRMAAHIDVLPTVVDLLELPAVDGKPIDGRSLRPLLEGQAEGWTDRMLFTHQARPDGPPNTYPGAVRTEQYRLVNEGKGWQLFDMQSDPTQKTDVAAANPTVVHRLSAAYDAWFADVSRSAFVRPPIEVGHESEDAIQLEAPDARLSGLAYKNSRQGYANDWIAGWTSTESTVSWEIAVVRAGRYAVSLSYVCEKKDAGSKIRVSAGHASTEAVVRATPIRPIPLPHRDPDQYYRSLVWSKLPAGTLLLEEGRIRLEVRALTKPGEAIMELKHVELRYLGR